MARITQIEKPQRGETLITPSFNWGNKGNPLFPVDGRMLVNGKKLYRPERTKHKKGGITNCDTIVLNEIETLK
jgi:hypothetical protein